MKSKDFSYRAKPLTLLCMTRQILLSLMALCLMAAPALAEEDTQAPPKPRFAFPVDCTLNEDCWILSTVDMDTKDGSVKDYRCQPRKKDGHKGTDFALRSRAEMRAGVNVLAAKDGTVLRIRDGLGDDVKSEKDIEEIQEQKKNCGNGVMIDHGNALFTQYCHLKKNSISVKEGDKVATGDILGQVGNSGESAVPHLHISIYWEGSVIDPFSGRTPEQGCGPVKNILWDPPIPYQHAAFYDGGFIDEIPDFEDIEHGQPMPEKISSAASIFVFWAAFYGVMEGDQIKMRVYTEDGKLALKRDITQDKSRMRQYYTLGKRFRTRNIPPGIYTGTASLTREGFPDLRRAFSIRVY